jgi:hypothetical protein
LVGEGLTSCVVVIKDDGNSPGSGELNDRRATDARGPTGHDHYLISKELIPHSVSLTRFLNCVRPRLVR